MGTAPVEIPTEVNDPNDRFHWEQDDDEYNGEMGVSESSQIPPLGKMFFT
jgi:hypothetical protein